MVTLNEQGRGGTKFGVLQDFEHTNEVTSTLFELMWIINCLIDNKLIAHPLILY